ncbi:MAG TPA: AMP-binding protein, partial [Solirubrobacteraceae bacterium]|nr:AMP-binding protein [Solirubrobacteraceae bacterium]
SELGALSRAGARELGVAPGERVAIALPAGVDFAVALHACFAAGAVAMPVDLREPRERWSLDGVAAIVDRPLRCEGKAATLRSLDLDDVALIVRTSGTESGMAKAVPLSFGNFVWSALGSAVALGLDPDERWLCTLPLVHVGGLSILIRSWLYGTTAVVHERFEAAAAVAALMDREITLVSVVATTLARLLDAGLEHPPRLRCALAGGGPVPLALVERAAAAGVVVSQTYGLTETCSQVATQVPGQPARANAGPPLFCAEVEIASDGEILVSGPMLSPGVGGVLATGDLGELDGEGNLRVIGRKADTIITGGENVAPAEVEDALTRHPAVSEAGVYGAPDPEWGEAVHALVVLRAPVSIDALRQHCAALLASYQLPKEIAVVDALPRTASGKLLRRDLPATAAL